MKVENRSYIGKKVFVGLNVHKKSYVIAASCEGVIVKKWTTTSDPRSLVDQFNRFFAGAEIMPVLSIATK